MQEYKVTVDKRGTIRWYDFKTDQRHRVDGPAIEYADGTKVWYLNGQCHRIDGPAIEYASGTKHWYLNGQLHRVGGPAVEYADGEKRWYLNGQRHRVDGPAVEYADGTNYWFLNGRKLTESEFNDQMNPKCDSTGQTVEINGVKYKLIKA